MECKRLRNPTNLDKLPRDREAFFHMGIESDVPISKLCGYDRLTQGSINKGLSFNHKERQLLNLHGLLPYSVETIDQQLKRCLEFYESQKSVNAKLLYLWRLESLNQRLYFRLLATDFHHFHGVLSSTVPEVLSIFVKPNALFITIKDKGHIYEILKNWPLQNVLDIIVSDGEATLGSTDVGARVYALVIRKLHLHTLVGGIKPDHCLPIVLDVGTNNIENIESLYYVGIPEKRVTGKLYNEFIDEFMTACVRRFGPRAFIQFDDFEPLNAFSILRKYQTTHCCCNNDIQTAGATVLAGIIASKRITNIKFQNNVFLFYGSRSRIYGIAHFCYMLFKKEGLNHVEALNRIWIFDSLGLVVKNRPAGGLNKIQLKYAQDHEPIDTLEEGVNIIKPTILIGCSGDPHVFTKRVLNAMERNNKIPIIFSLSTPQSMSECTSDEAFAYTKGRCVYVTSNSIPQVKYANKFYTMGVSHSGFIAAGISLGIMLSGMVTVPDEIFIVAAERLADLVPPENFEVKCLYPLKRKLRCCSLQVAEAVMGLAYRRNWATLWPEPENRMTYIKSQLYDLDYPYAVPDSYCTRDFDIGTKESRKHYPRTTYEGN